MDILKAIAGDPLATILAILGLGFIIFIHELGHFLVAKWNGVKVDKFSIGFGPPIVQWKRGETVYALSWIPLGGFVSMQGEQTTGEEAEQDTDPRSYKNKSVGVRMAIISAGVIVNFVFGWLCNSAMYFGETSQTPAVIGGVVAGAPAYEAGLRAGDHIVGIGAKRDVTYQDLQRATIFSGKDHVIQLSVLRPGIEAPIEVRVEPRTQKDDPAPTIGIYSARSLDLAVMGEGGLLGGKLEKGFRYRLKSIGPVGQDPMVVNREDELLAILCRYRSVVLVAEFEKRAERGSDAVLETKRVEIEPELFVDFGIEFEAGPVVAIRPGSVADRAGMRVGDRLGSVDGNSEFEVMRLPDLVYDRAIGGGVLKLEIEREGTKERIGIEVTPDSHPIWVEPQGEREPLEIPGLGCAVAVLPRVARVRAGSPAAGAGVAADQSVLSVTIPADGKVQTRDRTLALSGDGPSWPFIFDRLQWLPSGSVELSLGGVSSPLEVKAAGVEGWYNPMRGLEFSGLRRPLPPQPFTAALARGWWDSVDLVGAIFATVRGLFQQRLSPDATAGLPRIAGAAFQAAQAGFDTLMQFLGMLSINLAVINFLPIPPLDGGQMVLLAGEKLRGKPLPEKAVLAVTMAGAAMLLLLIGFSLLNDFRHIFFRG